MDTGNDSIEFDIGCGNCKYAICLDEAGAAVSLYTMKCALIDPKDQRRYVMAWEHCDKWESI